MSKLDIWRFLLFAFSILALHYGFLWRHLNVELLRTRLLALNGDLAKLNRRAGGAQEAQALSHLRTLIYRLAEAGPDLVYARIVLARLFMPRQSSSACRRALERIEAEPLRAEAFEILGQVEDAVSLKLLLGSPWLWLNAGHYWLKRGSSDQSRGTPRLSRFVPAYEMLESTLHEDATWT